MRSGMIALLVLAGLVGAGPARAGNHALLVGIDEYGETAQVRITLKASID